MVQCATLVLAMSMIIGQTEEKQPPQTTVPQNVTAEFAFLLGNWTAEFKEGDVTGKGVSSVSWSIDKEAVLHEQTWELTRFGKFKAVVLIGWDTAKREIVETTFFAGGGGAIRRYKLESPGVWAGESQSFYPDGTLETSKVRIERKNANEYLWIETNRSVGGQPQADGVGHFRRVK